MTPLFPDIHNAQHPFRELTDTARSCASFEAQRAVHVSVNGPVDAQTADDLRAHGNVRMIRLTASEEQLRSRIAARVLGDGGARLGRDDLRGASEATKPPSLRPSSSRASLSTVTRSRAS